VGVWEVCAGPNRSLLAWESSNEWLTLIYRQLWLRVPVNLGAGGGGYPKPLSGWCRAEQSAGRRRIDRRGLKGREAAPSSHIRRLLEFAN
jgi:hypothetical protein